MSKKKSPYERLNDLVDKEVEKLKKDPELADAYFRRALSSTPQQMLDLLEKYDPLTQKEDLTEQETKEVVDAALLCAAFASLCSKFAPKTRLAAVLVGIVDLGPKGVPHA